MSTNFYFQNYDAQSEQDLLEDLVIEAIQMYGVDTFYVPRDINRNDIFREAEYTQFNDAVSLEMYVKNVTGYGGQGKILSMMGEEVRDEMTFSVSVRRFKEEVGRLNTEDLIRPREGDLIYFPPSGKVFQITYVDQEAVFYQLGQIQFYDVTAELFEYNNEVFKTGIDYLDKKYNAFLTDNSDQSGNPEDADFLSNDKNAQNHDIQIEADKILNWSEQDPFSSGHY